MISRTDHVVDYVDDFLHGVLEESDANYVEAHCAECTDCTAALAEAEKRSTALKSVPPAEASEDLVRKTIEHVGQQAEKRSRRKRLIRRTVLWVTAASVLIIGGLNLYYYNLAPSPFDLRLLGQDSLLAGSSSSLRLSLWDRSTGKPVPNVPIELALVNANTNETIELATLTTDENGTAGPRFQLPDWDEGQYTLRVLARTPRVEQLTREIQLRRSWKLMLSSDKPVYQPGQTIHMRSLGLRRPDLKPVTGEDVTFTVTDPAGNVIFKSDDVMSPYGIASADCPMASEILEGSYQIECRVGETASNRTVEVQKYVLPKFKIEVKLDQPYYQPGQQVRGSLLAKYFFGKAVSNAEVKIDVRGVDGTSAQIARFTKSTDEQGSLDFEFAVPDYLVGREQDSGAARFRVVASVTDSAGQNASTAASRVVTENPIQIQVIPEAGSLVKDVANTIYIYTSYPDGRPVAARLAVSGVTEQIETNALGVASFELTAKTESAGLTIKATDEVGLVGRRHVLLQSGAVDNDFLIRPDKSVYAGGDTMSLVALGGGVEPVFVDFVKDDQTILSQSIDLSDGRGQLDVDLPSDVFGTIKLVAYRFGRAGVAVRRSRLVYVRQARELKIAADFDQAEYRPGDSAKLRFRLTDRDGRPSPGAISLAAVDEAVFSVLSQATGLAQTFFLLEQELLEPVYAIYDWSPFEGSDVPVDDRETFEHALFSRTATQVLGYGALPEEVLGVAVDTAEPGEFPMEEDAVFAEPEFVEQEQFAEPMVDGRVYPDDSSPFTLAAATFDQKVQNTRTQRRHGLQAVTVAWVVLASSLILVGMAAFAVSRPKTFLTLTTVILVLTVLVALTVPALNTVRESARSAVPMAGMAGDDEMMFDAAEPMDFAVESTTDMEPEPFNADVPETPQDAPASAPVRVRRYFPETLLWRPEIISDDEGVVELDLNLADSITTWRVSASAVTTGGDLGSAEFPIRVFQPFFVDLDLPVALTRNDEVSVPVVVYNYLNKPQTVQLEIEGADWFERLAGNGDAEADEPDAEDAELALQTTLKLELAPGEVRSLSVPIKVLKVGRQQLQITARGSGLADAVRREIEVVPDGRREEQVASGALDPTFETTLSVPEEAIEGSVVAIVKLYPSAFSQLVEGLDAIFQMPYGCFEQTSSTTYPNILALDYLRRTDSSAPAVEAKARQYIHIGYQRLVTFEVPGGGFDWFGNPPANRTLTAYGLMEFEDMAQVHNVDPNLIERTRQWLLSHRQADGSWKNEAGMLNDGLAGSVQRGNAPNLASTAYIAWAVFGDGKASSQAEVTLDYLLAHRPNAIEDPYLLAVVTNAIAAIDKQHSDLNAYLKRLDSLKQTSDDGKQVWWQQSSGGQTMFYGGGRSGSIETTAMATLALIRGEGYRPTAKRALNWLVEQKDDQGTWHSTQATVLALKALLAGTGMAADETKDRQIEIALDGQVIRKMTIAPDQSDVMKQINVSDHLQEPGEYTLRLTDQTNTGTGYQIAYRHHVEDHDGSAAPDEALSIEVAYDRTHLEVDDRVICNTTVRNNLPTVAPMVIVDLPIPGGFTIERGELDELVGSGTIAKYQITARKAIVYLRQLEPETTLKLRYRLRATMPVKVAVPPVQAYHYYDPDQRGSGGAAKLEATIGA